MSDGMDGWMVIIGHRISKNTIGANNDIVDDTDQVEWDEVSAARWFASVVQK